jgi:hypothetical protein
MSESPAERVRRVVLALESAGANPAALDFALRLARRFGTEVAGLLLDDTALRRAATLPFAAELNRETGEAQPLDIAALERRLRAQSTRLREQLEQAARLHGVPVSLRQLAVSGAAGVITELGDAEVLVIGRALRSPWARVAAQGPALLLYTDEAARQRGEAMVSQWLEAANGKPVTAFLEFVPWSGRDENRDSAIENLRQRRPRLVAVPAAPAAASPWLLQRLLEILDCPIVLLR